MVRLVLLMYYRSTTSRLSQPVCIVRSCGLSRQFSPVNYREQGLPASENLLKQGFYTSGPNQKWMGDITYLRTGEG